MTDPAPEPGNADAQLALALAQCRAAMEPIVKDAQNEHHGYRYAKAETVIGICGPHMAKHGLSMVPKWSKLTETGEPGQHGQSYKVCVQYVILHAGGGQVPVGYDCVAVPGRGRPVDKVILGVRTELLSYAYRDALSIPRVDEYTPSAREDDSDDEHEPAPRDPGRVSIPAPPKPAEPTEPRKITGKDIAHKLVDTHSMTGQAAAEWVLAWGKAQPKRPDQDMLLSLYTDILARKPLADLMPVDDKEDGKITADDIDAAISPPKAGWSDEPGEQDPFMQVVETFRDMNPVPAMTRDEVIKFVQKYSDKCALDTKFNAAAEPRIIKWLHEQVKAGKCKP